MFERAHHRRVAQVLTLIDAELLRQEQCLFGGGTAVALMYGEFRESVDIDFLVSDVAGYRALRQKLTQGAQLLELFPAGQELIEGAGQVRADQYGIRSALIVDAVRIKFEIVLEGRIGLEPPTIDRCICGVSCLSELDMATTKLLANSDSWADASTFNRDVIDLAMIRPSRTLLTTALEKAAGAYGDSVLTDLLKACEQLKSRAGWLERCMMTMAIELPKAVVWESVRRLHQMAQRV